MTENEVLGRLYRILTNVTNDIWDRLSFWKKASDVEFNDKNNLENYRSPAMLKRNTAYSVGDVAYTSVASNGLMFLCTTKGTTASTMPSTYTPTMLRGSVVTDGTAKFLACDKVPCPSPISNVTYVMPTVSAVNSVNEQLTANGKKFHFAYKNGKYGYTLNGDIDTFIPF